MNREICLKIVVERLSNGSRHSFRIFVCVFTFFSPENREWGEKVFLHQNSNELPFPTSLLDSSDEGLIQKEEPRYLPKPSLYLDTGRRISRAIEIDDISAPLDNELL